MVRHLRNGLAVLAFAAIILAALPTAAPAAYPDRPITLVVPFAPGGFTDIVARLVGDKLSKEYGQPVVVENRTGAGGNVAAGIVSRAPRDGYTLFVSTITTHGINPTLYGTLPYDPVKDFTPIVRGGNLPFMLVVDPKLPVKNVGDLVKLAASTKDQLSYGSAGPGSPQHLSMELLKSMTGMKLVHVPYKGDVMAINDLIAGHIPMQFAEATPALPLIAAGKVRAIGFSSLTRNPNAPDIPTLSENGAPGFDFVSWQMIVAPAKTPRPIVDKLHADIKAVLDIPEVKADFARTGRIAVDYLSVEDLQKFLNLEIDRLGKVVQAAGIAHTE